MGFPSSSYVLKRIDPGWIFLKAKLKYKENKSVFLWTWQRQSEFKWNTLGETAITTSNGYQEESLSRARFEHNFRNAVVIFTKEEIFFVSNDRFIGGVCG